MNEHLELYGDSDGVFANFDGRVCSINNVTHLSQISRGRLWRSIEEYDRNVEPFFESLEKHDDADILMQFCRSNFVNFKILTASGYVPKDGAAQKKRWYAREYGPDLHVKVVTKSIDKAAYAHPRAILIDDRSKSIDPWVEAGGIGVLHTDAASTIARLKEIIEQFRVEA